MADSYYPEDDMAEDKSPPAADESPEEGAAPTTALLPKSILAGKDFKPGEEIVLKVTHVYDDEVAVEYAAAEPETEEKPEMTADEEIDSKSGEGIKGPPMMAGTE